MGNNQPRTSAESGERATRSEYLDQVKEKSSTYFHYLLRTIKRPSSSLEENNRWFGYVTYILMSLSFAIIINRMVNSFIDGLFGLYDGEVGSDVFFKLFFYHLVFLAVLAGTSYGINRLLLKNNVNFNVFLTRYSGFLSLALGIYIVAILFSLILGMSGVTFIFILLVISLELASLAYMAMLVLPKNNGSIDRFYILTIGWAIIAIISFIVFRSAVVNVFEAMGTFGEGILNSFF